MARDRCFWRSLNYRFIPMWSVSFLR